MKIIFAGTSDFAACSLNALYKSGKYEIECVISQPDRPVGRKHILKASSVKEYALSVGLPVYQPEKISSPDAIDCIRDNYSPKAFIVAAYGQKIPSELLYFTDLGTINVHGSVLPELRGAAPIQHAIINGFKTTGVTTMMMNEGMDTGDILLVSETDISADETYGELSQRLAVMGSDLLLKTLFELEHGNIKPIKQNNSLATKAMSIKKEHTVIDFNKSALEVYNLIRGLNPKPNAICKLANKNIKVLKSRLISNIGVNFNSGEIISVNNEGIEIACGMGSILFIEVQPESSKVMSAFAFAQGLPKSCIL